ncbi:hypothetical protein P171DRAFT_431914 [Karstenula rhodostoma CBS 690.94]|uniref:Altered inheritance of mitochondria protein 21 n=1 Tax=Karstenula rhodostoma CBS 690.94 TaxID=1392251 RepID=A0A9P4PJ78_9PLEO|nr:hypothetical protein P171DRAFT_431914 [Karstenula rhodostoma CBS 690.94]
MSAPPQIPPRPTRAQNSAPNSALMDVPKIPPRPKRSVDRSVSPGRDAFARSPLNDPSFLHTGPPHKDSQLSAELPSRPPSVSLPSLGQEGSEYASFDDLSKTLTNQSQNGESPEQTKQVAGDLPLHAPKASLPASSAKTRIQTVTRTDSDQAAAAGFGKSLAPEGKPSGDSSRSVSSRPSSIYREEEEHGIPEIGVQVPMYPNAGDVQAPTPSPYETAVPTGVGFFNKGDKPRHHSRTKSGREIFHGPPGSYGLHGHGKIANDEFEQNWYKRHPEDLKREKAGEYGPHIQENRKDYHWGGEKLDKLVRNASVEGYGLGTSREAVSTPDEHIGFLASEEYASRMASPRPRSSGRPASISEKGGAPVAESPLRQANFPTDVLSKQKTHENEAEEDVIHIDPPHRRESKIHGGGYDPPTHDLGRKGGNTDEKSGWVSERGYGTPILASDEIKKDPESGWRQPAIPPELERRGSGEYTVNDDATPSYITKQRTHSRPHSRSSSRNSNHANPARIIASPQFDRSGIPLDSMKEYEPLFPEDDDAPKKAKTPVDKIKKRPDLARHQFPSQDVWEDAPSSLQLETTVDTAQDPEEPKTAGAEPDASQVFENPQTEQARKEHITKEDQQSFLPEHTKKFANKHLKNASDSGRPGVQRFPSQDIWEDTPEHFHLETTVSTPQTPETNEYADDSPVSEKPSIPARPNIPARPQAAKEASPVDKKAPVLPERPKPQVPARPNKPLTKSSDKVPTVGAFPDDNGNVGTEAQPKAKPPVPARPAGSKIAALQAGFLKDLNSKLGLGPPKVKEPEPEKEEEPPKPLEDARKGRAKGPQRRKPTKSPTPAATVTAEVAVPPQSLSVGVVSTLWQIGDSGAVEVPAAELSAKLHNALKPTATPSATSSASDTLAPPGTEDFKDTEDILEKEEHVEPGEASLEPAAVKDAEPSAAAVAEPEVEASNAPVEGQTVERTDRVTVDPADAEPVVEAKVPGGVSVEEQRELQREIEEETREKLAGGDAGEVKAEQAI